MVTMGEKKLSRTIEMVLMMSEMSSFSNELTLEGFSEEMVFQNQAME